MFGLKHPIFSLLPVLFSQASCFGKICINLSLPKQIFPFFSIEAFRGRDDTVSLLKDSGLNCCILIPLFDRAVRTLSSGSSS